MEKGRITLIDSSGPATHAAGPELYKGTSSAPQNFLANNFSPIFSHIRCRHLTSAKGD
jgi:hypothetical protein